MTKIPRYDFAEIIARVLQEVIVPRPDKPYLGIDECLNHPQVNDLRLRLHYAKLVAGSGPLWKQRRIREDGTIVYADGGGVPRLIPAGFDIGKPEKNFRWDDELIVRMLIELLRVEDVVFITENTRLDSLGLRKLLRDFGPQLDDRVSLIGLFKLGKTTYAEYCQKVIHFMVTYSRASGYREVLL